VTTEWSLPETILLHPRIADLIEVDELVKAAGGIGRLTGTLERETADGAFT
jgi:hypothetical protein